MAALISQVTKIQLWGYDEDGNEITSQENSQPDYFTQTILKIADGSWFFVAGKFWIKTLPEGRGFKQFSVDSFGENWSLDQLNSSESEGRFVAPGEGIFLTNIGTSDYLYLVST